MKNKTPYPYFFIHFRAIYKVTIISRKINKNFQNKMRHNSSIRKLFINLSTQNILTSQPADCRHYSTYCSAGRPPYPTSPDRYVFQIVVERSEGGQLWTLPPDVCSSRRHRSSGLFGSVVLIRLLASEGDLHAPLRENI